MRERFPQEQPYHRAVFVSRRWLLMVTLVIIIAVIGILFAYGSRGSDVDRGTGALIAAFSKRRLIEPRLSGGFKAGEFRTSSEEISGIEARDFERARDLITDATARGDLSAELPYARLLLSKDEKLPEALRYLRRAVARAPESAEAHNDLGVCLTQQGKLEDAIDEFDVALNRDADMLEALFNRALCYRRLRLRDAEQADLSRLVEVERDSGWLTEAKQRLDELAAPAPTQDSTEINDVLIESLATDPNRAREIVEGNYEAVRKYFFFDLTLQYLQPEDKLASKQLIWRGRGWRRLLSLRWR